jgi:hypothetical protein
MKFTGSFPTYAYRFQLPGSPGPALFLDGSAVINLPSVLE